MRCVLLCAVALILLLGTTGSALAVPSGSSRVAAYELQFHLSSAAATEQEVEQALVDRSTPGSKLFRHHLSQEELIGLVGASDAAVKQVVAFLTHNGVEDINVRSTKDVVTGRLTPHRGANLAAFSLTEADFGLVPRPAARLSKVITESVKASLGDVPLYSVLAVAQIPSADSYAAFAKERRQQKKAQQLKSHIGYPFGYGANHSQESVRKMYSVPLTAATNVPSNFSSGTGQIDGSGFNPKNIETFSNMYGLPIPTVHTKGPAPVHPHPYDMATEGTMDVEIVTSISGGVDTWWIAMNQSNTGPYHTDFAAWAEEVLSIPNPPSAISVSYAIGYDQYEGLTAMLEADNRAFRKLGLRGITVFAGAGDDGTASVTYPKCDKFVPLWPTSSPYITSVGGTYSNSTSKGPEGCWEQSGGGFSTVFSRPSWQSTAVKNYLDTATLPSSKLYNSTGRAYPDVAAISTNFAVYAPYYGHREPAWIWEMGGTSLSGPIWAGVMTRLNLERVKAGKPTVGFLNPAIYALGRVGQDVTIGHNDDVPCAIRAFPTMPGWDAVTGLGTPDFNYLLKHL